jgi:FixJ family two-component response regulator
VKDAAPLVFVVDDDPSVREGLSSLLRSVGLHVRTFTSAEEFLRHPRPEVPACVVLDVRMPGLSGLELQRELATSAEGLPIIFITGHGDIPMTVRAMKAGAVEFLPKPFRDQDLLDAIQQALERNRIAKQQRAALADLRARYELLTGREREVLVLVAHGMTNKQVAARLGISEITVKVHRGHLMRKMKAGSLPELVRIHEQLSPSTRR